MIDIRCSSEAQTKEGQRCQLLLGHEGYHACMFADRQGRAIATWPLNAGKHGSPRSLARNDAATAHAYPWAPSFPVAIGTMLTAEHAAPHEPVTAEAQLRLTGLQSVA